MRRLIGQQVRLLIMGVWQPKGFNVAARATHREAAALLHASAKISIASSPNCERGSFWSSTIFDRGPKPAASRSAFPWFESY